MIFIMSQSAKLIFNIYKSPIGINWKNPATLAATTAINTALVGHKQFGHTLGHLSIKIVAPKNESTICTGIERVSLDESRALTLKEGAGLGTLIHNFKGQLEGEAEVNGAIEYSLKSGGKDLHCIEFLISDQAYQRMREYYQLFKASKTWLNYCMNNHPRYGEGSGCTAYGISFLEVIGFKQENLLSKWRGEVLLPIDLIGPYSDTLYQENHEEQTALNKQRKKVSILQLLNPFSSKNSWAKSDEDHIKVLYYSPDLMFKWVNHVVSNNQFPSRMLRKNARSMVVSLDLRERPLTKDPLILFKPDHRPKKADFMKYQEQKIKFL
jgi:hypothetical protein